MALSVGMVTLDCRDPQQLARLWSQALGIEVLADYGEFVLLGGESSPVILGLQRVPEPKVRKNRVHLDLSGEPRAAAAARLQHLEATFLAARSQPGLDWIVLADPEGNEFCVGEHDQ